MLLAEIHGKTLQAARDSEDYLTSTVFSHLRYVPPHLFWPAFLAAAKGVPGPGGDETTLLHVLAAGGIDPAKYERLEARFWKSHPTLGEPDLFLLFTGGPQPPLVVLVEVKLWSDKSGTGEQDQLVRYLGVLADLGKVVPGVPTEACRYLVYLTPRESLGEVEDSLASSEDPDRERGRLFRFRWQDIVVAAGDALASAPEPAKTILGDVARFLRVLGLDYFGGFKRTALPTLPDDLGSFYQSGSVGFRGFCRVPGLGFIQIRKGAWA